MLKIGVLISGGGSNLQAIIDSIKADDINGEIVQVISNREKAYGLERAKNEKIPALFLSRKSCSSDEEYDGKIISIFKEKGVELVVLAGYLRILTPDFIKEFKDRIINIHPSLVPAFSGDGFYGSKVHEAVIERGVKITGATVHFVNEITDGGPIIHQSATGVEDDDTAQDVADRVLELEHAILPYAVKLFAEKRLKIEGNRVKILEGN
ncbi:MAG: phosphoribosylglycinamide formyltransferase [Tissierellia bacterium]|nr:phosphoribosylglycinamide formyltransferase [Tissierellia bacterium]